MSLENLANSLYESEKNSKQIEAITKKMPNLTTEDAYKIQLHNISKKIELGEKVVGMKIGLTSVAMQELLGVNEPDYGHITSSMVVLEGQDISISELCQPKVEGELAFCLKKELKGPNITIADVYNATSWVAPAIEIVDSRIKNWEITLQDTVADNGSSARLILGSGMTPISKIDMKLTGMTLEKNGKLINSGVSAEVLGNPAASVMWLVNKLAEFDIGLEAGQIILSGALTAAQPAKEGDFFNISFYGMGSVGVRFSK